MPLGEALDGAPMSRFHVRFWLLAGLGILLDGFDFFIIGVANPLVVAGFRLFPAVYDALVGPLLRTFALARDEVPPSAGNVFASRPQGNATHGRWAGI